MGFSKREFEKLQQEHPLGEEHRAYTPLDGTRTVRKVSEIEKKILTNYTITINMIFTLDNKAWHESELLEKMQDDQFYYRVHGSKQSLILFNKTFSQRP